MQYSERGKRIIGLCGGIGSGKSVVARILRLNGIPVYDCDSEAKKLMETDCELMSLIVSILGEESYSSPNRLNKEYVASRIFSDNEERERLNIAVHKAVKTDFLKFCKKSTSSILACESAIIKTSGLDEICNEIWLVEATDAERIKRVKHRNGLSEEEIIKRIEIQRNENNFSGVIKDAIETGMVKQIENNPEVQVLSVVCGLISDINNTHSPIGSFHELDWQQLIK